MSESVVEYVTRNPQAMDTLEGIASWWIAKPGGHVDTRILQRVLNRLTEGGVLERIGAGEHAHYRLRRERVSS